MKADLGPLDKRVRIERKTSAVDPSYGTPVDSWDLFAVVFCSMQDELPSKSESVRNGLAVATQRTRIRMRYIPSIDSAMRIIVDGKTYQIVAGPAVLGQRDGIELFAERYSTNG